MLVMAHVLCWCWFGEYVASATTGVGLLLLFLSLLFSHTSALRLPCKKLASNIAAAAVAAAAATAAFTIKNIDSATTTATATAIACYRRARAIKAIQHLPLRPS